VWLTRGPLSCFGATPLVGELPRSNANDETKAAPLKEMETTVRHMREMTKYAEHAMHTVVLSCKRARRQMLAGVPASKPTMH
jgi:hypothetical protein